MTCVFLPTSIATHTEKESSAPLKRREGLIACCCATLHQAPISEMNTTVTVTSKEDSKEINIQMPLMTLTAVLPWQKLEMKVSWINNLPLSTVHIL